MKRAIFILFAGMIFSLNVWCAAQEWKSGIEWKKPPVVEPSITFPSDAISLIYPLEINLEAWEKADGSAAKWKVEDNYIEIVPRSGDIQTKQKFGSVQLHVEFATPTKENDLGQNRGNSGVFLMNNYEVQILDSYQHETYYDGQCAAIYKQRPPLVNVCRTPGEWQTFDIIFMRPELKITEEDGKTSVEVIRLATITVLQNGILVINHHVIQGSTHWDSPPTYQPHADKEPIRLQDHGSPVRFRNIWVRELE